MASKPSGVGQKFVPSGRVKVYSQGKVIGTRGGRLLGGTAQQRAEFASSAAGREAELITLNKEGEKLFAKELEQQRQQQERDAQKAQRLESFLKRGEIQRLRGKILTKSELTGDEVLAISKKEQAQKKKEQILAIKAKEFLEAKKEGRPVPFAYLNVDTTMPVSTLKKQIAKNKEQIAKNKEQIEEVKIPDYIVEDAFETFVNNSSARSVTINGIRINRSDFDQKDIKRAQLGYGTLTKTPELEGSAVERLQQKLEGKRQDKLTFLEQTAGSRSDRTLERIFTGAAVLGTIGGLRGLLGVAETIRHPIKTAKSLYSQVRHPVTTAREIGKQFTIDPVGVVAEFYVYGKALDMTAKAGRRSPVGRFIQKELFIRAQPREIRTAVRKILNAEEVAKKIDPYKGKVRSVDFLDVQSLTKTEAKALAKTLREVDAVVFGSGTRQALPRSLRTKLKVPKDVDIATANKAKFSRTFIRNLPKAVRGKYKVIGGKLYRQVKSIRQVTDRFGMKRIGGKIYDPIFDVKNINRLIPDRSIFSKRGYIPVSGYVKRIKGLEKLRGIKFLEEKLSTIKTALKSRKLSRRKKASLRRRAATLEKKIRVAKKKLSPSDLAKIKEVPSSTAFEIKTGKIKEVGGIKFISFGEQVGRKALGTLKVLIEEDIKRAKDPQSLIASIQVQMETLRRSRPATALGKIRKKARIKTLRDSLRYLKSKEFSRLLERKVPGLTKEYPLVAKIDKVKLRKARPLSKRKVIAEVKKLNLKRVEAKTKKFAKEIVREKARVKKAGVKKVKAQAIDAVTRQKKKIARIESELKRLQRKRVKGIRTRNRIRELKVMLKRAKADLTLIRRQKPIRRISKRPRKVISRRRRTSKLPKRRRSRVPSTIPPRRRRSKLPSKIPRRRVSKLTSSLPRRRKSRLAKARPSKLVSRQPGRKPSVVPRRPSKITGAPSRLVPGKPSKLVKKRPSRVTRARSRLSSIPGRRGSKITGRKGKVRIRITKVPEPDTKPDTSRKLKLGFIVLVKKRGKLTRMNKALLPKNRAWNKLIRIIDNTPQASGIILRKGKTRMPDVRISKDIRKFRGRKGRSKLVRGSIVEKNKARFDRRGEKKRR